MGNTNDATPAGSMKVQMWHHATSNICPCQGISKNLVEHVLKDNRPFKLFQAVCKKRDVEAKGSFELLHTASIEHGQLQPRQSAFHGHAS
ncbi:hypothetical protein CBS147339_5939 [Penicillium roqueforti]|uniref:uncharacterized protein n=1 Tax=Penicillium roqueforti TaxID=5082 RepID=UPI00190BEE84|nr:uncharacterized protein LCP9604111_9209 [Penicillium roqueforti]KAF9239214.1 hypothetical protein LCP9604111_9209 [Penicillium roqueforti]KAI2718035.1 hypothetical protein CBS147318_4612 [Penicillium roqueforti]KAI2726760.1 hypothetical protein CBS147354_3993 [Penicillium roqueforti]KAI2774004.1 hypothetical protein DTO012A8_1313 [Penicillium roqueforti]KAI3074562.1 hypothetical protein CBS147339_5939 [Penicillium roqueforti]